MTGPEHYERAESLLGLSAEFPRHGTQTDQQQALLMATQAQAHATLALVAATAMPVSMRDVTI